MVYAVLGIVLVTFLGLIGYMYDLVYLVHHLHAPMNVDIILSMIGVIPSFGPFIGWFLIFFG